MVLLITPAKLFVGFDIWYASRLAIASNLPNPFNNQKYKSQNRDTLKSPWLMPWGTLTKNYTFLKNSSSHNPLLLTKMVSTILWTITPFLADISGNLLSHILPLDKNDVNNPWTKSRPLLKIILTWGVVLQSRRSSMACSLPGVDESWERKKKERLIVMSCTWKIRLSPNENQESQIEKK